MFSRNVESRIACVLVFLPLLTIGCGGPERPSPYGAFDEIARRALADDLDYMNLHVTAGYQKELESDGKDGGDAIRSLMHEVQRFKAASDGKAGSTDDTVIQADGIIAGADATGTYRCSFKLHYHETHGWQLDSGPFDKKPITKTAD